jgi:hypothetical protein
MSRRFGSLLAGLSVVVAGTSGILSFVLPYTPRLSGVHTLAGFAFLIAAAIHIAHNARTWLSYLRAQRRALPSAPFLVASLLTGAVLAAAYVRVRPAAALLAWGDARRDTGVQKPTTYQTIQLNLEGHGPLLTLDVKAGPWFQFTEPTFGFHITPQLAAWTEDEGGRFLETLYVTRDEGRSGYDEGDERHTLSPRPAALPVWAHRIGVTSSDSPLQARHPPVPDVVSSASPTDNTYLVARTQEAPAGFFVYLEVNSSFDYNDYYRRDSFPDEVAYSNGGNPAQPSVVYRAWVDPRTTRFVVMSAVGHGHHAGADGRIDPDLSHLTTALQIIDRIVIEVREAS